MSWKTANICQDNSFPWWLWWNRLHSYLPKLLMTISEPLFLSCVRNNWSFCFERIISGWQASVIFDAIWRICKYYCPWLHLYVCNEIKEELLNDDSYLIYINLVIALPRVFAELKGSKICPLCVSNRWMCLNQWLGAKLVLLPQPICWKVSADILNKDIDTHIEY